MSEAKFKAIIKAVNERRDANGIVLEGKKYLQVRDRVEVFRAEFGDQYGIDTHVSYSGLHVGDCVVAVAKVTDKLSGNVLSSGHSMEIVGSSEFNNVSAIESAETSAVGRALAFFGLAGGEFPSADEMDGVKRKKEADASREPSREPPRDIPKEPVRRPVLNTSGMRLYQPDVSDGVDFWGEASKVIDQVTAINEEATLVRYWGELKYFLDHPQMDEHSRAEIKAVFSMVKGQIKGRTHGTR